MQLHEFQERVFNALHRIERKVNIMATRQDFEAAISAQTTAVVNAVVGQTDSVIAAIRAQQAGETVDWNAEIARLQNIEPAVSDALKAHFAQEGNIVASLPEPAPGTNATGVVPIPASADIIPSGVVPGATVPGSTGQETAVKDIPSPSASIGDNPTSTPTGVPTTGQSEQVTTSTGVGGVPGV